LALVDGKRVVLRVPFPMSFYAKGLEGNIDNPDAGWKGRGVRTPRGPVSVMRASFERNGRQAQRKTPGITGSAEPAGSADGGARQLHRDVRRGKSDLTGGEGLN
jgi:hypothetical protein